MSELKPVKVGIVGCGNISDIYLKNSAWLDMIEVKGVTDLRQELAQAQAEKYAISTVYDALDAMLADDGRGFLYFPLFNYADGDLDALHAMHSHPQTRMGLSDGGAHCGAVCDGGMPTFMLTHWTRDRQRGERLPLEYIIKRQTSETAATYGLHDRGVLAPGMKADVNVLDPDRVVECQPEIIHDFPGGAPRFIQRSKGYRATIVNGQVSVENGEHTGVRAGGVLRHAG